MEFKVFSYIMVGLGLIATAALMYARIADYWRFKHPPKEPDEPTPNPGNTST